MRQGFLRRSRYSPGNMNRESLEALFVGRDDVMEGVLTRITKSIRNPEKHYILLVGPRGSGKTHFLSLACHRLMDRLDTSDKVAVAFLNEEEWGVTSYLDLIVRILRALASQAPELQSEITEIFTRFPKNQADAEIFAISLLQRHVQGKTLLLVCENLVDLFDGLGEEGQKRLRATIQEDANWAILASTPSLFTSITMQKYPFYGFFTIRALESIDLDTGIELLARKAVHEDRAELANFLRTPLGRARARAIHHLAAGNHRAYVVLFDFLEKESIEELIDPFMHMVDDLTPYYQDRMRQLPPAQRKIVEFLCLQVRPATVKDIATPCLMSQQTAAKQIAELGRAGFVRRIRSGRNTFCELSEPLMRICIEVKDNKTQYFRLFVEFLRRWFTTREFERRRAKFVHGDRTADLDHIHVEEAIRCFHIDRREPFLDALDDEAERCWEASDFKGLASIQETLARESGRREDYSVWLHALLELGEGKRAIAVGQEATARYPDDADILSDLARAYLMEARPEDALCALDEAIALTSEDTTNLCLRADILLELDRFEEAIIDAQTLLDSDPSHWHSHIQIIEALVRLERIEEAGAQVKNLIDCAPTAPDALLAASSFYYSHGGRLHRALELVDRALDLDAGSEEARRLRGYILFDMENYHDANEELRRLARHHPHSISTLCKLSDSLLRSGEFKEAADVAENLIEIDPEHSHAYYVRGSALNELGRIGDAIASFNQLLSTDDRGSLLGAASEVRDMGEFASAKRYLDRVADLQPDNQALWIERTRLHIADADFDAAAKSAKMIEALPDGPLPGILVAAQASAAAEPLEAVLDTLESILVSEEFDTDVSANILEISGILSVSVRIFGPQQLPKGLARLRILLKDRIQAGVIGDILTDFLIENVRDGFEGSLANWDEALECATAALNDLPDCRIPIEMLQAAVRHSKTGDERILLSLPLEQRQLLEDVLPPA